MGDMAKEEEEEEKEEEEEEEEEEDEEDDDDDDDDDDEFFFVFATDPTESPRLLATAAVPWAIFHRLMHSES